jgi:hypothetical protein
MSALHSSNCRTEAPRSTNLPSVADRNNTNRRANPCSRTREQQYASVPSANRRSVRPSAPCSTYVKNRPCVGTPDQRCRSGALRDPVVVGLLRRDGALADRPPGRSSEGPARCGHRRLGAVRLVRVTALGVTNVLNAAGAVAERLQVAERADQERDSSFWKVGDEIFPENTTKPGQPTGDVPPRVNTDRRIGSDDDGHNRDCCGLRRPGSGDRS